MSLSQRHKANKQQSWNQAMAVQFQSLILYHYPVDYICGNGTEYEQFANSLLTTGPYLNVRNCACLVLNVTIVRGK